MQICQSAAKKRIIPARMLFALMFAGVLPHEYVCLWHPLSVLADIKVHVEATPVKRDFSAVMS